MILKVIMIWNNGESDGGNEVMWCFDHTNVYNDLNYDNEDIMMMMVMIKVI